MAALLQPSSEEILIIGEILRINMHKDPGLIKDRRFNYSTYSCCFVGMDLVDWLLKNREASSRDNAVHCIRKLQENGVLHHVMEKHIFKDEQLFYRFRIDDGTFFVDPELENYHQAIIIHQRILGDSELSIFEDVQLSDGSCLEKCFTAQNLVSWLVQNNCVRDRYAAIALCQQLMEIHVIRNINFDCIEFFDDNSLYRFIFDQNQYHALNKSLGLDQDEQEHALFRRSMDDAMNKLGLSEGEKKYLTKLWHADDVVDFQPNNKSIAASPTNSDTSSDMSDGGPKIPSLKPVVLRHVTAEELLGKDSPYYWKNIRIVADSVGFGFVIRGEGPSYIQAIDPQGPAAEAGLKLRMYLYSVNGKIVLRQDHRKIADEVMEVGVVDLVVLQHFNKMTMSD